MPEKLAPGVSYAQAAPVTCPACGHDSTAQFWLITAPLTLKEGRP
jgi:hypothetical protein